MRRLQFKFPSQIRISGWDFGSSARAMNQAGGKDSLMTYESVPTQAELGKGLNSTTERKIMSTKTSIKRIALVAVAALGFGMVSTVSPASAAYGTHDAKLQVTTAYSSNKTANATSETATAIAGAGNYVGFNVVASNGNPVAITVTGGTASTSDTATSGSGTGSLLIGANVNSGDIAFTVPTPTVGTIVVKTYKYTNGVLDSTATATLTITVNAATSGVGVLSVGNSTSIITDTTTATTAGADMTKTEANTVLGLTGIADNTIVASKGTAGSPALVGFVIVKLKDSQASPAAITSTALTATVSGAGLITGTANAAGALDATTIARVTSSTTDGTNGVAMFGVYSDGTSGTGTITVSYYNSTTGVTTTVSTETITFYGTTTKLTIKNGYNYISNSGSAISAGTSTDYVFRVKLTDANDNPVRGTVAVTATPADLTKVAAVSCGTAPSTSGYIYCTATAATGASGKTSVKFEIGSAAAFNYVTASADLTVSSVKADKFVITADPSVSTGGLITYTITATDANGLPVADGTSVLSYLFSSPQIAGGALKDNSSYANINASVLGSPNETSALFTGVYFADGKATDTVQAPFGKTSIVATFLNNGAGVATTAGSYFTTAALRNASTVLTTSVSNEGVDAATDAANEATDAANAATDAANAAAEAADAATAAAQDAQAAVAALATQVSSLIAGIKAQITSLTNLVIKIQKKVRA